MKKKPKYEMGQKVFILSSSKIVEDSITGIFAFCFKEKNWRGKESLVFEDFVYFLGKRDSVSEYGWIYEKDIFSSKEELINSL